MEAIKVVCMKGRLSFLLSRLERLVVMKWTFPSIILSIDLVPHRIIMSLNLRLMPYSVFKTRNAIFYSSNYTTLNAAAGSTLPFSS